MTCKRTQGFLESVGGSAAAVLDAKKVRMGPADALALARKVDTVVATRGKNVVTISLQDDRPSDDDLLTVLMGPTGNLRAPAAVVGRTLVVGFNEAEYRRILGA
jgi:arsenate reductase-like glutaredoxin family protein